MPCCPAFCKIGDLRLLCSSLLFVAANFLFCDHIIIIIAPATLLLHYPSFPLSRSGWDLSPNRGSVLLFFISWDPLFPFPFFPPHGSAVALHFLCPVYLPSIPHFFSLSFPLSFSSSFTPPFISRRRSSDPLTPNSVSSTPLHICTAQHATLDLYSYSLVARAASRFI